MLFRAWILYSALAFALLYTAESAISGWTSPDIKGKDGTGTLSVSESQATTDTIATYEATTDSGPITYTLVNTVTPFALSNSGVLTITSHLDAETTASYTLKIQAVDSDSSAAGTGTATITVTVTDVNEVPVFGQTSYTTCIANESPEGLIISRLIQVHTSVITVTATNPDPGDTLLYSIDSSSNTNSDFKIDSASGEITVNTGKTLSMTKTPNYSLVVKAIENNSAPKTGTATVSIEVAADGICSGAAAAVVSVITIMLAVLVLTL